MAVYFTGTLLASPIVRGSSGDTYGTHHSILGVGGYMEVNTLAERDGLHTDTVNGIYFDGMSSGQRRLGMLVYVRSEDKIYQLKYTGSTAWDSLPPANKVTELGTNSNWVVFNFGNDNIKSDRIIKEITQITHSFSVGDVIGWDSNGQYSKAIADGTYDGEFIGVVTEVINNNAFKVTEAGYFDTLNSLSADTTYFLSDVNSGQLTPNKPIIDGHIVKSVLIADSSTSGWVLPYVGYIVTTGNSGVNPLDIISGATNIGFFSGKTGTQTLPITYLDDLTYNGNYISLYNNYYRDGNGIIQIGAPLSDNIYRRGYYNIDKDKSWIWNDALENIGWYLIDGNVKDLYSQFVELPFTYSPAYSGTGWTEGLSYSNGSKIAISTVLGNLTTGSTYINGGGVYSQKNRQKLQLRTIISETPNLLQITSDDYFIKISGSSTYLMTDISDNYTGTTDDYVIVVDTTVKSINVLLPLSPVNGMRYKIKDGVGNALTNVIIIDGNGHNIDGESIAMINTNYGAIEIVYDAANTKWLTLGFIS